MKPMIKISDLATGQVIEREMNDDEVTQWRADIAQAEIDAEAANQKQEAKNALLAKLGITAEEAKLLLS